MKKISYYDLLTLLKDNKPPKNVVLYLSNKKCKYKYDLENGYIRLGKHKNDNIFNFYLSDSLLDNERFIIL